MCIAGITDRLCLEQAQLRRLKDEWGIGEGYYINAGVVLTTMSICGFVDSLVISRRLGPQALAAVGFFSPIATGIGMFNMLVNVLSVAETAMVGLFAFLFVPVFGINAAWLGNAVVDLICLGVILVSVWVWKGGFSLQTGALLKLPDDFGASPEELWECTLRNRDSVCDASESAVSFCLERGFDRRGAYFAGLCIEEMARNIFQHGGHQEKDDHVDVRMVVQDELTIRIRDNCIAFDPRKRLEQFHPEDPSRNIGIRLTAGIARQIDY